MANGDGKPGAGTVIVIAGIIGAIWYFNSGGSSTPASSPNAEGLRAVELREPAVDSCSSGFDSLLRLDESAPESEQMNELAGAMASQCPDEFGVFIDFIGIRDMAELTGMDQCSDLRDFGIERDAIALAEARGLCIAGSSTSAEPAPIVAEPEQSNYWPEGGLGWNEARDYAGSYQRVCGPLKGVRGSEDGVFVNIGADYPSGDRFTFVIWGDWWLEPIDSDAVICAEGEIYLYGGVGQMEFRAPDALEIWQ